MLETTQNTKWLPRMRPQNAEHQKLLEQVRTILKSHGYETAANSNEFIRMSKEQLKDILKSWDLWDKKKQYSNV
jgi:DnaJ-domain-containing protein 1